LIEAVLGHPIYDETIRREQAQRSIFFDSLQGPYPGIELLLGQLAL
jgi:hypothetical protein